MSLAESPKELILPKFKYDPALMQPQSSYVIDVNNSAVADTFNQAGISTRRTRSTSIYFAGIKPKEGEDQMTDYDPYAGVITVHVGRFGEKYETGLEITKKITYGGMETTKGLQDLLKKDQDLFLRGLYLSRLNRELNASILYEIGMVRNRGVRNFLGRTELLLTKIGLDSIRERMSDFCRDDAEGFQHEMVNSLRKNLITIKPRD